MLDTGALIRGNWYYSLFGKRAVRRSRLAPRGQRLRDPHRLHEQVVEAALADGKPPAGRRAPRRYGELTRRALSNRTFASAFI